MTRIATMMLGTRTLGLALSLTACSFKTGGLADLADTATYLNFPGTLQMVGPNFKDVRFDTNLNFNDYILGLRDGNELILRPNGPGAPCSAGPAVAYVTRQDEIWGPDLPYTVPFLAGRDTDGRGELKFAYADCAVWSSGLLHSELAPFVYGIKAFLVRDARDDGDALAIVDPWQRTVVELARGVKAFSVAPAIGVWTLEGSGLFLHDFAASSQLVWPGVTDFLAVGPGPVFLGGTNLIAFDPRSGSYSGLARDACQLRPDESGLGAIFLSPCAEGQLNYYDGAHVFLLGEAGAGVAARVSPPQTTIDDHVLVLSQASELPALDGRWVGTLSMGRLQQAVNGRVALEKWGDAALWPESNRFRFDPNQPPRFIADFDGLSGRLVEANSGASPVQLADDVSEFDGTLAIVGLRSGQGKLLAAYQAATRELVSDVSSLANATWYSYAAGDGLGVTRDAAAGGTLEYALASTQDWWSASVSTFQTVQGSVVPESVRWLPFGALGYLHDFDASLNQGTLSVQFLDNNDRFDQPGVSEWTAAEPGSPGEVAYVIPRGADAGVWIATAK